jgi:hypothetical protein
LLAGVSGFGLFSQHEVPTEIRAACLGLFAADVFLCVRFYLFDLLAQPINILDFSGVPWSYSRWLGLCSFVPVPESPIRLLGS